MTPSTDRPPERPRRRRADARRNRARLLTEAEEVFREQGTGASLEEVARRAGVAVGTLYAHFPHRRALLEALLRDRQEAVFALGDQLLEGATPSPPFEALARWMRAVAEHTATYRGLSGELMGSRHDEGSELHAACARMTATGRALVDRASSAGAVREGITVDDVLVLVSAAAWVRGQAVDDDQADRTLAVIVDGLRR